MKRFPTVALFLALTAISQSPANAQKSKTAMTGHVDKADSARDIHQDIYFNVAPQHLYLALLSSEQFSASTKKSFDMFSATSAKIDAREGGSFSLFDGHIIGRILELVPNKRIVEAWRVVDWPAGVYSIARFDLEPKGTGTRLSFDHLGFPAGLKEHLTTGWQQHYWDALDKYFQ
jgi:activator of HSP90 ATPase